MARRTSESNVKKTASAGCYTCHFEGPGGRVLLQLLPLGREWRIGRTLRMGCHLVKVSGGRFYTLCGRTTGLLEEVSLVDSIDEPLCVYCLGHGPAQRRPEGGRGSGI